MRVFIFILMLVFTPQVWSGCFGVDAIAGLKPVAIAQVYDGDTVRLADGRKVRVLNINTPELGRGNSADEPFARLAAKQAKHWLGSRDVIFLLFDIERKDRYGRWLAHLLDGRGQSLAEHLLQQGLAEPLAVPPNLDKAACYFDLATKPQSEKLGVWAVDGPVDVIQLSRAGFQRIRGTISKITKTRAGDYWIELQGRLAIQVRKQDLGYFDDFPSCFSVASKVEVSGWVVDRSKSSEVTLKGYTPWTLQVRTAYAITVVDH